MGGATNSTDYPTSRNAFDKAYNGGTLDHVITRLSGDGSSLVFSTYLGGSADEGLSCGVDVNSTGEVFVVGTTISTDFPTTPGVIAPTLNGLFPDLYVARLNQTATTLTCATYLGGTGIEFGNVAIDVDTTGRIRVAGLTTSTDFPTTQMAFDRSYNGGFGDAAVSVISADCSTLFASSFLGGTGSDLPTQLITDPNNGDLIVAGTTSSPDFPTTSGAYDRALNGSQDVFVTALSSSLSKLSFSTFLGGNDRELGMPSVAHDRCTLIVSGATRSSDFPTTPGAFDRSYNGGDDSFVARLHSSGTRLFYCTYLGSGGADFANAILPNNDGGCITVGTTGSPNFPTTTGAFDTTYNGGVADLFVTEFDLLPAGVSTHGVSTVGCSGRLWVTANSIPQVGNTSFSLLCVGAPARSGGAVAVSTRLRGTPLNLRGALLYVSSAQFSLIPISSNLAGCARLPIPIPQTPAVVGQRAHFQFGWADPCSVGGLSSSPALAIVVQP